MKFSNSYIHLSPVFYQSISPTLVKQPKLLLWNDSLAASLQLSQSFCDDHELLAQYFSGNKLPMGAQPIALAYAGHQFGHFNPQLGDGRAHLLGEIIDRDNIRRDVQLKGSGPTQYSRQGDGRCALGPALREYIMSEAMYALGVPTSRCLAVVATGETIYRGLGKPGAVVTRIASSHIRVGSFQYFAARGDLVSLKLLTEYAISRHFPEIDLKDENYVVEFIKAVIEKQIILIVHWMRVGFIHGVMNTDNTAVCGETIDFGPCAMMGIYHPGTVFSSIDTQGRYAFARQANISQWNMARLAECLLSLIDSDDDKALSKIEPVIRQFSHTYKKAYLVMLSNKLGFNPAANDVTEQDEQLINDLLALMQQQALDYTVTFNHLTQSLESSAMADKLILELGAWYSSWRAHLNQGNVVIEIAKALMEKNNPVVIPRNHQIEEILAACEETGEVDSVNDFLNVLRSPYTETAETKKYQVLPVDRDIHYQTFCGT